MGEEILRGVRDLSISHSKIMWNEVFIGWKVNYDGLNTLYLYWVLG